MAEPSSSSENSDSSSNKFNNVPIEVQTQDKQHNVDPELDELLDSALGDFDDQEPEKQKVEDAASHLPSVVKPKVKTANCTRKTEAVIEPKDESSSTVNGPAIPPSQEAIFNELFGSELAEEASKEFESALQDFMKDMGGTMDGNPPMTDFANLFGAESFQPPIPGGGAQSTGNPVSSTRNPADLSQTLGETFQRLSQTAQELQADSLSEEDLLRSMAGLNLGGGDVTGGTESILFPMMQEMMQGLLSKDILYPSLKEIVKKYPEWLQSNEVTLEKSEFERYSNQHKLMGQLCDLYESEKPSDSQDVKQKRLLKVIELVQKMEALGQPPTELAGDMPPGLDLDGGSLPNIPGMPPGEQCVVM